MIEPPPPVSREGAPDSASDPATVRESRRRRTRFWVWTAVAATPFLAALAYYGMLWSWTGDYLEDARFPAVVTRLALSPWPRWETHSVFTVTIPPSTFPPGSPALVPPSSFPPDGKLFVASPAGATLIDSPMPGWGELWRAWKRGGTSLRSLGENTVAVQPPAEERELWMGIVPTAERYPIGALDAFRQAYAEDRHEDALAEALKLVELFPDRATPKYWAVSLNVHLGRMHEASKRFEDWLPTFAWGRTARAAHYHRWILEDLRIGAEADPAARQRWEEALPSENRRFRATMAMKDAPASLPLEELSDWMASWADGNPPKARSYDPEMSSDIFCQYAAFGVVRSRAMLLALAGRGGEARRTILGAAAATPPRRSTPEPISGYLGCAMRMRLCEALEELTLRSNLDADELEAVIGDLRWKRWMYLDGYVAYWSHWALYLEAGHATSSEKRAAILQDAIDATTSSPPLWRGVTPATGVVWAQIEATRWALLREGLRAKWARAATGRWPAIQPDGSLERVGPPRSDYAMADPWSDPPRLLRARLDGDDLVVYSVGVDRIDDGGKTLAEPEKEIWSGDFALRVPAAPLYDFPKDADHVYAGIEEFERRYPAGLPVDWHNKRRRLGLSFAGAAPGEILAWSVGFDATPIEPHGASGLLTADSPGAAYDPTNGLASAGDIVVSLKIRTPGRATSTPAPNSTPADGETSAALEE